MKVWEDNEVNDQQCDMPKAMVRIGIAIIVLALLAAIIATIRSGEEVKAVGTVTPAIPTVEDAAPRTIAVTPSPSATPTAKPTKKPKPTQKATAPRPKPTQKASSRSNTRPNVRRGSWSQGEWGRFPAYVEVAALCVAKHESWGRLWYGENPISTASGAFQWIDSTWRVNAARAGVKVTSHASYSPPRDQAKVFAWMWTHGGKKAWRGTNCPGTY